MPKDGRKFLTEEPRQSASMVYIDPPFGHGHFKGDYKLAAELVILSLGEIDGNGFVPDIRADLVQSKVAMADSRERWNRKLLFYEESRLFKISGTEMGAQRHSYGVRSSLGHRREYELVLVRDDHAPAVCFVVSWAACPDQQARFLCA